MPTLQHAFKKNDEYYTPAYAVYPIVGKLVRGSTVWCPFDKEHSNFVQVLRNEGFTVIHGHIETGQDFFSEEVPQCDYIISNPPYSIKGEVFQRLYDIGKPFAMLVNFQGIFDHKGRFEMFREQDVQMMWLSPRVNYIKPNSTKTTGVPFQSGYLCKDILDKPIEFYTLNKKIDNVEE